MNITKGELLDEFIRNDERRKGDCNREPEKRIEEERRSVREALAAAKQTKRNVRVKVVGGNQEEQLLE